MASILASPQAARKKRFVKLELGSFEGNLPTGTNPFEDPKVAGGTIQHGSKPDQGYGEIEGTPPSTLTTHPIQMPIGSTPPLNSEPGQGFYKGSIDQEATLEIGTYV